MLLLNNIANNKGEAGIFSAFYSIFVWIYFYYSLRFIGNTIKGTQDSWLGENQILLQDHGHVITQRVLIWDQVLSEKEQTCNKQLLIANVQYSNLVEKVISLNIERMFITYNKYNLAIAILVSYIYILILSTDMAFIPRGTHNNFHFIKQKIIINWIY